MDDGYASAANAVDARKGFILGILSQITSALASQADRWRLWAPVAFGGGCGAYFTLKEEPSFWPFAIAAAVLLFGWIWMRRLGLGRLWTAPLMLLACFALGLTTVKLRQDRVDAPIAPALSEPVRIEGWVVDVDSLGERGVRIVLAPAWIEGLTPEQTPHRIRATVKGAPPIPGTPIRLFAVLNPPPGPAAPGAYDFGRWAYFQSLGGVALALTETREADLRPAPFRLRAITAINKARFELAQRIVDRLGSRTGGVAAAMTTGHEAWIGQDDLDAMRDSGLAHILSISGLHMAIVGGFVFFIVRLGVAAWPWLALRAPGKKIAAWGGIIAVAAYLVISGAPPPAVRAAVTAWVAFAAILLNRQAITMQALGVAAFVVLLLQPEAVVSAGFQMSFAATAALVALSEVWPRRIRELNTPLPIALVQRGGSWVVAACAASLVAGLATGPFAMQHFNRTAIYGLVANMATAPISSFLMMPALAVGAALEPLGLGGPFLTLAGWGVELMLAIGTWTAGLPGAVRTVASAPTVALPVAFLGLLWVCLWRGWMRLIGLPFAAAVMLWPRADPPDLWIGNGGANAGIVQGDRAEIVRLDVSDFATDTWSRRRGLERIARPEAGWVCSRFSCRSETGGVLAIWWGRRAPDNQALEALCRSAEVVSVRAEVGSLPSSCGGRLVLDGRDHATMGPVELWRAPDGSWLASTTTEVRGDRPWSRAADLR